MHSTAGDTQAAPQTPINLHNLGRVRILQALTSHARLSRADLVRHTGLARTTVSSVIFDLISAGLVRESPDVRENSDTAAAAAAGAAPGQRTGRPPLLLRLEPEAAYAVGLDVGHDHVRAIVTDVVGTPRWDRTEALAVDDDPRRALDTAVRLIAEAVKDTAVPPHKILGLGLGIACPVDKTTGGLHAEGIMPGWVGTRPADDLAERTGLPTQIINDANAGVLAERRFGAAREATNVVYVRLAAGIGAGMMSEGRMLLGHHGLAGELGHVMVELNGAVCRCGSRGCLETVASPAAIAGLLARSWGQPADSIDLPELLRRGDRGALRVVEDAGEAVGRALSAAVQLLNPQLVVIGGDLAEAGEALLEPIRRTLRRGTMGSLNQRLRIVPSTLGDSAGVRGAAALVLDSVPQRLALDLPARGDLR
ncbi:ROK family protein [Catenulispora acidiphila DSM 44928]|uniref:ROK family protein n=1 Tax=Catenulispora acidiphila (strain DSM 44928 / JCM 14897 / NBRC 102108 / NRRL B-24433 / ID139908) TaxID=479433 RepID=C7PY53_CATAD|nr:ROK family transcriptional regulator [Catenulispora acidiphila]ACU73513.1 ROK family protein [Catenulispora acidiphila DSM 44928]